MKNPLTVLCRAVSLCQCQNWCSCGLSIVEQRIFNEADCRVGLGHTSTALRTMTLSIEQMFQKIQVCRASTSFSPYKRYSFLRSLTRIPRLLHISHSQSRELSGSNISISIISYLALRVIGSWADFLALVCQVTSNQYSVSTSTRCHSTLRLSSWAKLLVLPREHLENRSHRWSRRFL